MIVGINRKKSLLSIEHWNMYDPIIQKWPFINMQQVIKLKIMMQKIPLIEKIFFFTVNGKA